MTSCLHRVGVALVLGAALLAGLAPAASAQAARQQEQFAQRMESLRALAGALKRQAAEKGVDRSETLARVEARMREADSLAAAGELDLARSVLDEAYLMVKSSIEGLSGQAGAAAAARGEADKAGSDRAKRDYEARVQSARALREALARKGAERKADVSPTLAQVDALLAEGSALAANGDYERARSAADRAYQSVKLALDSMLDTGGSAQRQAAAEPMADKRAQQFDQRAGTVKALSDALARMSAEKGVNSSETLGRVEALSGQARSLRATDPDGAWRALDDAYALVKGAIDQLRTR